MVPVRQKEQQIYEFSLVQMQQNTENKKLKKSTEEQTLDTEFKNKKTKEGTNFRHRNQKQENKGRGERIPKKSMESIYITATQSRI